MNVFLRLFSARSQTGTTEWKEPEWSWCQGRIEGAWGGGERNMNTGKCTLTRGKKKRKKKQQQEKPETQIGWRVWGYWHYASFSQMVAFVMLQELSAMLFLFPSLLRGVDLSCTPHPAGNRAALKAAQGPQRAQTHTRLPLKSLGAECSWVLLKCEVVCVGFINTLVLVLHLHKNCLGFRDELLTV